MSCNCWDKINVCQRINNSEEVRIVTRYCTNCKYGNRIKLLEINVDFPSINLFGCLKTILKLQINGVKVEKILGNNKIIDIVFNRIDCLQYRDFLENLRKTSILTFNDCFIDKDFYNFMSKLGYIRLGNVFVPKVYDLV